MRKDIRRRYDAHVRVNSVCAEHRALYDATPGGQQTCAALGTYVADQARQLAAQERSLADRRTALEQCRAARRSLRNNAKAVVRVGQLLDLDRTAVTTLELPREASDDELIAYSKGLLDRVSAYTDAFIARGLPPDVLKNVDAGIQELAAARDARATAIRQFAAAAAAIRDIQNRADKTVAALEAIAINLPAAHPEAVTKLRLAKRVGPRTDAPADPAGRSGAVVIVYAPRRPVGIGPGVPRLGEFALRRVRAALLALYDRGSR